MAKTIKVRGIRSIAGDGFSIAPREVKKLPKHIAEDLLRAGHVEAVKERSRKATDDTGEMATEA